MNAMSPTQPRLDWTPAGRAEPPRAGAARLRETDLVSGMGVGDKPCYALLEWLAVEAGHCGVDVADADRFTCLCGWATHGSEDVDWSLSDIDRHVYDSASRVLVAAGKLSSPARRVFVELAASPWQGTLEELICAAEGVAA